MKQTGTNGHCRDPNPLRPFLHARLHQRIVLAACRNFAFRHLGRTGFFPYYLPDHGHYLQVARYWLL